MGGLCYSVSKFLDLIWSQHLEMSAPARDLVQEGIRKRGSEFAGFGVDVASRLYLVNDPPQIASAPDWATRLHTLATELGEWQRLRLMCSRNGFAAGIAAEAMLEQLLPHVPARPPEQPGAAPAEQPAANPEQRQREGPGASGVPRAGSGEQPTDTELRASLRRAIRSARDAVRDAEAGLEGVSTPLGFSMPGRSVERGGTVDLRAIRDAHSRLSASRRLKRIAELAGRLQRVAAAKLRSRVRPGVGQLYGISLGGLPDLARLLPSELVAFRRPRLRTLLLARLTERRALCYSMEGREPLSRGPIVVLLDESGSMRESGKDIWSKAVALALFSTAAKQRRAAHVIAFNGAIVREVTVSAGRATAADIQQALDHGCRGGTDFDAPVLRAVEIIRTSSTMRAADCILITDGEDELEPATVDAARALTKTEGVSWYVIGVGPDVAGLQSLVPIATNVVHVLSTEDADDLIAPVLSLDPQK